MTETLQVAQWTNCHPFIFDAYRIFYICFICDIHNRGPVVNETEPLSCQDGLLGKGACYQALWPEFNSLADSYRLSFDYYIQVLWHVRSSHTRWVDRWVDVYAKEIKGGGRMKHTPMFSVSWHSEWKNGADECGLSMNHMTLSGKIKTPLYSSWRKCLQTKKDCS